MSDALPTPEPHKPCDFSETNRLLAEIVAQKNATPWLNTLKEMLPGNYKQIVSWIITAVVAALGTHYGMPLLSPPPPPPVWVDKERVEADAKEKGRKWERPADGWKQDRESVDAVVATLPQPFFAETEAGKADDPLPDSVYHWQAYTKLFARPPPSRDQGSVGSCVSFGTNTAIERTMAVAIVNGEDAEYRDIVQEVTYAGSRVQIGKKQIRGDGSIGAWAAQFVRDYGIVSRGVQGKYDLSAYSVSRCREWGNSGVPADLIPVSKEHPVQSISLVKTWADAKKALASGYGIAICSNVGFEGNRDKNGVKVARGSWGHCMALDGYHTEAGQEYGHIENSWGPRSNEGPVGWGNPPSSGFWVASATIERMLRQGDSWAFSTVKGFPAKKLDWFVLQNIEEVRHAIHLELRPVARPGNRWPIQRRAAGQSGSGARPGKVAA